MGMIDSRANLRLWDLHDTGDELGVENLQIQLDYLIENLYLSRTVLRHNVRQGLDLGSIRPVRGRVESLRKI